MLSDIADWASLRHRRRSKRDPDPETNVYRVKTRSGSWVTPAQIIKSKFLDAVHGTKTLDSGYFNKLDRNIRSKDIDKATEEQIGVYLSSKYSTVRAEQVSFEEELVKLKSVSPKKPNKPRPKAADKPDPPRRAFPQDLPKHVTAKNVLTTIHAIQQDIHSFAGTRKRPKQARKETSRTRPSQLTEDRQARAFTHLDKLSFQDGQPIATASPV